MRDKLSKSEEQRAQCGAEGRKVGGGICRGLMGPAGCVFSFESKVEPQKVSNKGMVPLI